jgi:hypothetical protein
MPEFSDPLHGSGESFHSLVKPNPQTMETTKQTASATTRSVGIKYGLYVGLASIAFFLLSVLLNQNPFKGIWNWIGVIVTVVLMVLAHKNFKDNGEGFMSYGEGFAIGLWLTVISTVISIPVMYIYLTFIDTAPMELFFEDQRTQMEAGGAPEEAIEMAQKWTRKLFWVISLVVSIIGGVVIALILTIFTQKKASEQAF